MNSRISTTIVTGASLVMGWAVLTASQCGDVSVTFGPKPGCSTYNANNFPNTLSGSLDLQKPADCPIKLLYGIDIPYSATAHLLSGTFAGNFFQSDVVAWNGTTSATNVQAVWSLGGNGDWFVSISGTYPAARAGFNSDPTGPQYDDVRNSFYVNSSSPYWTYIAARIPYKYGTPSVTVSAPGQVEPYTQYAVTARTDDWRLSGPTTWSWYINGQLAGTTDAPGFTITSGDPSSEQQVSATATDANGNSTGSGNVAFVSTTAGCGTPTTPLCQ